MKIISAERAGDYAAFPALWALGLGIDALEALRRQGYLSRDQRLAGKRPYWRLRFRQQARLRTVFIGSDDEHVLRVRAELTRLRAARETEIQLNRAVRRGSAVLRATKKSLTPVLLELGLHYHGDTVRRFRSKPS